MVRAVLVGGPSVVRTGWSERINVRGFRTWSFILLEPRDVSA